MSTVCRIGSIWTHILSCPCYRTFGMPTHMTKTKYVHEKQINKSMWFIVVCTFINNDTRHHSVQNVVDSRGFSAIVTGHSINTKDVLNRVCSSGQCCGVNLKDSGQMLLRTQKGDLMLFLLLASPAAVSIGPKMLMGGPDNNTKNQLSRIKRCVHKLSNKCKSDFWGVKCQFKYY